jgi:phosphoribosylcarboxyaminoimidazole (NCAIR) mutase
MRLTLAFAVRPDHVTAVAVRHGRSSGAHGCPPGSEVLSRSIAPRPGDGTWPDLAAAIAEAHAAVSSRPQSVVEPDVCIVLLPPLARAKAAALPHRGSAGESIPVTDAAARRVFLIPTDRAVVAGALVTRSPALGAARRGAPADALVACADDELVTAVTQAAATACCGVSRITAASAVLGSALALVSQRGPDAPLAAIAVCGTGWTSVLLSMHGRPVVVLELGGASGAETARVAARCLATQPGAAPAMAGADAAAASAPAPAWSVFGIGVGSDALARELASTLGGPDGHPVATVTAFEELDAAAAVAAGATLAPEVPPLLPAFLWSQRASRTRRRGRLLWSQALAALGLAAGLHLWGLDRELSATRAARGAERPRAAAALVLRSRQEQAVERLAALARIAESRGRWAEAVGALASALPDTAYVTALAGEGSVLRVSGRALAARTVVPALAAAPLFRDAALRSPVRPVGDADGAGVEEFEVVLTVAPVPARTAAREVAP